MSSVATSFDLSTIRPPRETVLLRTAENPEGTRPDGSPYELNQPEDLSTLDMRSLERRHQELSTLWNSAREEDSDAAEQLLNEIVQMFLPAPIGDIARLPAAKKWGLVRFFTGKLDAYSKTFRELETTVAASEKSSES